VRWRRAILGTDNDSLVLGHVALIIVSASPSVFL